MIDRIERVVSFLAWPLTALGFVWAITVFAWWRGWRVVAETRDRRLRRQIRQYEDRFRALLNEDQPLFAEGDK